jgi:hypothetical protein
MLKTTLWILFAVLIAALIVIAPNALWLSRSSALIHNNGAAAMTLRLVITGESDRFIEAGVLAPGTSRFLWIDPVGEATLAIEVRDGDTWRRHCGEYIEAGMYRVEITARAPDEVTCRTELPFLDRLLVLDYLS